MKEVAPPHDQVSIARMLDVASSRVVAHVFVSNLEPPTLIFEGRNSSRDGLLEDDIYAAEIVLTRQFETGVLYSGTLDPADAALTAAAMIWENKVAAHRT